MQSCYWRCFISAQKFNAFLTHSYAKHTVNGEVVALTCNVSNRNVATVSSVADRIFEIVRRRLADDV